MSIFSTQFNTMMWKNWIVIKRNPRETIFDIIYPLILLGILMGLASSGKNEIISEKLDYPSSLNLDANMVNIKKNITVVFSPIPNADCNDNSIKPLIDAFKLQLSNVTVTTLCFKSKEDILNTARTNTYTVGFNFQDLSTLTTNIHKPTKYEILYSSAWSTGYSDYSSTYMRSANTYATAFSYTILPYEITMNNILLSLKTEQNVYRFYTSQLFPSYEYTNDMRTNMILYTLPIYLVLIVGYPYIFIVRRLLEERETKVQEGYLMIGLRESVWWMTWYVTSFMRNILTAVLIGAFSLLLFQKTGFGILCITIFIMSLAIMTQSIGLSSFFDKADTGCGVVFMILLLTGSPYAAVMLAPTWAVCLISFFLPTIGIAVLGALLCYADTSAYHGVTFSNMFDSSITSQNINFGAVLLTILASAIFWFFLGLYMNKVIHHTYGVYEKPCFCLEHQFCHSIDAPYTFEEYEAAHQDKNLQDNENIEPISSAINISDGLHMVNICKTFPSKSQKELPTKAVRNFSATFFNNHINVLLGHNGAGKSTLISILTGLYAPTDGDAFLNGSSLAYNKQDIRSVLGVCPQQNVLLNLLTVEEHLRLFGKIRNISDEDLSNTIETTLKELGLYEKRNSLIKDLSGGMKRKVSVAIAFIGNPKLIFLDEPTAGMDPVSRRYTWKLLEEKKHDHIIVLCTHFMDEADFLADYIYIMSNGQLQVAGSSLFLKNKFGLGYHLTLNKLENCENNNVLQFIQQYIPSADIEVASMTDINILLPRDTVSSFPTLLSELKNHTNDLHISNIGINATTLEEVFLTLSEEQESEMERKQHDTQFDSTNMTLMTNTNNKNSTIMTPTPHKEKTLLERLQEHKQQIISNEKNINIFENVTYEPNQWLQFKTLFWKKFKSHIHQPRLLVQLLLVPSLCIFIGIIIFYATSFSSSYKSATNISFNPSLFSNYSKTTEYFNYFDMTNQLHSLVQTYMPSSISYPIDRNIAFTEQQSFLRNLLDTGYNAYGFNMTNYDTYYMMNIYYNDSFSAVLPTTVNLLDSFIYNILTKTTTTDELMIESSFTSFPSTVASQDILSIILGAMFGFYVITGFAMIPSFAAVDITKERVTGARLQERIMGVSNILYWLSTLLYDLCFTILPLIVYVILSLCFFNNTAYILPAAIVIIILCQMATLPLAYLIQFMFNTASAAETGVGLIISMGYLLFFVLGQTFRNVDGFDTVYKIYNYICYLNPLYAAGNVILNLQTTLPLYPESIRPSIWSWDFSLQGIIYLIIEAIVYMTLTYFVEQFTWTQHDKVKITTEDYIPKDEDVQNEINRINSQLNTPLIQNGNTSSLSTDDTIYDPLTISHIWKVYPKTNKQDAVQACKDITFGIKKGECFGLIGPNGAGKTSLLSILTGTSAYTKGSAYIEDYSIPHEMTSVYPHLGYCPQFDVLFDFMTVYECLYFYGTIKGIKQETLSALIVSIMNVLGLEEHRNKLTINLSGGNKRRLCVAIAFMGNPNIIIMDEPSTGLDPVSRHKLWDLITSSSKDKSFLLTTHLMEEADYLCDRIGILINGQLQSIGTSQHLKSKYGEGYTFDVKVEDTQEYINSIKSWVSNVFGDCNIRDEHRNHIIFVLSSTNTLEYCFETIEKSIQQYHILDYTLSQTTLDQVFLQFAKKQNNQDSPLQTPVLDENIPLKDTNKNTIV